MEFIDLALLNYCEQHSTAESEILKFVSRETHAKILMPRMLSGHLQGNFLAMLSLMLRPQLVVEIGTYTGYSAICLAQGLQAGGQLHTIDINEELEEFVKKNIEKAQLQDKITLHIGNAMTLLPELALQEIDLVFIDADKKNYAHYYDLVIDRVRQGGWIVADNVLWSGKVVTDASDKDTLAIKAFNDKVQADDRVFNSLLPLRDGLMICQKK